MAPWHLCYKSAMAFTMAFAMAPWHLCYNNAMANAMALMSENASRGLF